ncbi:MAG: T9SS type A sorting domain-containing protein [Phaeodactylibacter sp.]|nr:T9SS type A sorting domain-containing protein [Phaeodactylibacter sp.]
MKTKCIALSCSLLFVISLKAQIPTEGLVGYYMLNGDAADSSGLEHHGLLVGDLSTGTDRMGLEDGAIEFNGGYIDLGNPSDFQFSNAFSISLWMNTYEVFDWSAILTKWANYGNGGFYLGINPAGNVIRLNLDMPEPLESNGVPLGDWLHLVATFDSDSIKLYEDGVLVSSAFYDLPVVDNAATLLIGSQFNIPDDFVFYGRIDDVLLYNRALTANEVMSIFTGQPSGLDEAFSSPIQVFPNPTASALYFKNIPWEEEPRYTLHNTAGRRLQSGLLPQTLELGTLPAGVYWLQIRIGESVHWERIVRQ